MVTLTNELIREDGTLQTWTGVGGYSLTFFDGIGGVYCGDCASKDVEDMAGAFIHWEGAPLQCEACDCDIESEYGDPFYTCDNCGDEIGENEYNENGGFCNRCESDED